MSVSSISLALIPYSPPKAPMEFIRLELERGLKNGTIKPEELSMRLYIPSNIFKLMDSNVNSIWVRISEQSSEDRESDLLSRRINRPIDNQNRRFLSIWSNLLPNGSVQLEIPIEHLPFISISPSEISEDRQKLSTIYDNLDSSSRITSSKKLNGDEIAEALQSEASFTIATDEKPIVATYGASFCIALGGYDVTNKLAFIVHFSNVREVTKSSGIILDSISKLAAKKIEKPIQLHLRGGVKGYSEAMIEAIKLWMKIRSNLPMEIASEDVLNSTLGLCSQSLSIDSRNGEVAEYNPMDNSKHRDMSELDIMHARFSTINPSIKIAYYPKLFKA